MARRRKGIMLSSSFRDLEEHRQVVLKALKDADLIPINMENRAQPPSTNTLKASIDMVDEADGFLGIIGSRYGTIVEDASLNPDGYSLTEVEYRRARELEIPMSMFVMSEEHRVKQADVELSQDGREKLSVWKADVSENFTFSGFDSVAALEERILRDVLALRDTLDAGETSPAKPNEPHDTATPHDHPHPPEFWAMPRFTPGHEFVGRTRELQLIDDWALDPENPLLLFEAIGGMGKSMLTWQWARRNAGHKRPDLAGAFWYSFYERGADMGDFVRHALAYVSDRPIQDFKGRRRASLTDELLPLLGQKPWLLVLDGLERILVAYHRIDKAQLRDEQVASESDSTEPHEEGDQDNKHRPRDCIRNTDTDLLQQLAQAGPSKILISSRLTPTSLLNRTGMLRPGVQHHKLAGLDAVDAEGILRQAEITGGAARIRNYLRRHFDCHPLIVGVVAGLVRHYRRAPGDFEKWADDPNAGAEPHLAEWDVVQKKNHILKVAFDDLTEEARTLLGRLALISEACDDATLEALNPFLNDPPTPAGHPSPQSLSVATLALAANRVDPSPLAAQQLNDTRSDLEQRGLLQWDRINNTYDLHPVVRGYVLDSLGDTDLAEAGERVAEHFSRRADPPYEQAEAMSDLRNGLQTYEALVRTGQVDRAFRVFDGDLSDALRINVDQPYVSLELLRPLFTEGLGNTPALKSGNHQSTALNELGLSYLRVGQHKNAEAAYATMVGFNLRNSDTEDLAGGLFNLAVTQRVGGRIALSARTIEFSFRVAQNAPLYDLSRLAVERSFVRAFSGAFEDADLLWAEFKPHLHTIRRELRPGAAEFYRAQRFFFEDRLDEANSALETSIRLALGAYNRETVEGGHSLRGEIRLIQKRWAKAIEAFEEALHMRRESGLDSAALQARIAIAQARSGDPDTARRTLVNGQDDPPSLDLAELYLALGEPDRAREHAPSAYEQAWADGPPYACHWNLQRAKAVYAALGDPEPELPPYDPDKVGKIAHEDAIIAFIEKLDREQAASETD